jgi:hypothetical protein
MLLPASLSRCFLGELSVFPPFLPLQADLATLIVGLLVCLLAADNFGLLATV